MRSMQQQLGNFGTISAFAYRHRETKKIQCRGVEEKREERKPDYLKVWKEVNGYFTQGEGIVNMHMFRIKCCYNETALNTFHVIKLKWSTVLRVMTAHQGYTVFVLAAKVTVNGGLIRHTVRHTRLKKEH